MSGENILLVEDEENLVEALRFSLTREGYQVMVASDGEQGLLKARQESPDLVLLDIILPQDGPAWKCAVCCVKRPRCRS